MSAASVSGEEISLNIKTCLLNEASKVLRRDVTGREELRDEFNINKLLTFIQNVYEKTGVELDVNSFYMWKTTDALARAIEDRSYMDVPKLLLLREGDESRPLIVFAGGVSCFLEIKSVLEGLDHNGVVYGMCLSRFERPHSDPATVADEVNACVAELAQHSVPAFVSLLGYSFGGVFALELARKLPAVGRKVRFLGLIDTPQSEHTWPFRVWLKVVCRRFWRRVRRLLAGLRNPSVEVGAAEPPAQPAPRKSLLHRLKPVLFRFCPPTSQIYPKLAPEWAEGHPPDYEKAGKQLLRMRGLYRPQAYQGGLVFYRAQGGSPNLCDPREIWEPFLHNAEWVDVRGSHLSVIFGKNGIAIGQDLSQRLRSGEPVARSA